MKVREYIFVTLYGWIFFNVVLTPLAILVWRLSVTQFYLWWISDLPLIPFTEYLYYHSTQKLVSTSIVRGIIRTRTRVIRDVSGCDYCEKLTSDYLRYQHRRPDLAMNVQVLLRHHRDWYHSPKVR